MIGASVREPRAVPSSNHRSGGIWDYISPSRLNCWLTCPLKFKIRYIDRIRTPTTPALFLGKHVHAGLEVFYRHRQLGVTLEPSDVAARMVDGWDAAVAEEVVGSHVSKEQFLELYQRGTAESHSFLWILLKSPDVTKMFYRNFVTRLVPS